LGAAAAQLDPGYATSLQNLGTSYYRDHQFAKAEPLLKKSVDIYLQVKGAKTLSVVLGTLELASLYEVTGRHAKADSASEKAINISETLYSSDHPRHVAALFSAGALHASRGDFAKAEAYYLKAISGLQQQINTFFPTLSDYQKTAYYLDNYYYFEKFNALCILRADQNPAILGKMYDIQLATKALLQNSTSKWKQRIRNSGDKKLFALYSDWEHNQRTLSKWLAAPEAVSKKQIDSLAAAAGQQEKELSKRSEMFTTLSEKKQLTWLDVKAKLKPGEAAIEIIRMNKYGKYSVTDSSDSRLPKYEMHDLIDTVYYTALVVTSTSTNPEMIVLKNGNDLETKYLKYYFNCISGRAEDKESYNLFWKPIADRLAKLKKKTKEPWTIYFSGDGVYNQINLNTLYNTSSKKYLLDEMKVSLVTNTKDLVAIRKEETVNNLAYLFGYPDYGVSIEDRTKLVANERDNQPVYYALNVERNGELLSELPGTKAEVETIAALMTAKGWQPEVYTGDKALEETLKDCFKPRVLHIATHGFFQSMEVSKKGPLLSSGLMLAGAGQTLAGVKDDMTEDGILTALEAMNLNLDDTDLVVLSACETGLGENLYGGGVYGLQRAFKIAGAKSIIMSLWKVNDEATQNLMTAFYENWLNGEAKRQAFNHAQQMLKEKYKSPYYWGAFVMVGE
jgi:CHAT domain-containing protein